MGFGTTDDERLTLRWVEVGDDRGRTRMEMRWTVEAPEVTLPAEAADVALPVEPAEVLPAATTPPPVTPAA